MSMTKDEMLAHLLVVNQEAIASWPDGYVVITVVCRKQENGRYFTIHAANCTEESVVTVLEWAIEDAERGGRIVRTVQS